ncbi:hypothetical protein ACKKBG_A08330 [Auxenochlorella protothecoides x Auxenochlorella symbiontica]
MSRAVCSSPSPPQEALNPLDADRDSEDELLSSPPPSSGGTAISSSDTDTAPGDELTSSWGPSSDGAAESGSEPDMESESELFGTSSPAPGGSARSAEATPAGTQACPSLAAAGPNDEVAAAALLTMHASASTASPHPPSSEVSREARHATWMAHEMKGRPLGYAMVSRHTIRQGVRLALRRPVDIGAALLGLDWTRSVAALPDSLPSKSREAAPGHHLRCAGILGGGPRRLRPSGAPSTYSGSQKHPGGSGPAWQGSRDAGAGGPGCCWAEEARSPPVRGSGAGRKE